MKKVLIISYHFPPMNVIASRRAEAYAMFLREQEFDITVLTHRWEIDEKEYKSKDGNPNWKVWDTKASVIYEDNVDYKVIRVPRYKSLRSKLTPFTESVPFLKKAADLFIWANGHLDSNIDSYYNFRDFLWSHLKNNNYDVVLTIFTPHNHIKLAYEIKREFGIPFIADYRDLWDNDLLLKDRRKASTTRGRKIFNYLSLKFHKKWLKEALFYSSVSQPIVDKIAELCEVHNGYCIKNGYESNVFSKLEKQYKEEFIILHGGTIYEAQDISAFIKGLRLFWSNLQDFDKTQVRVIFLAIKTKSKERQLIKSLPEIKVEFTQRLPREQAIQLMKDASILFYPSWTTTSGIYSGKIFEYLGAGNNILVIPNDHDVVEELINRTGSGLATDSPEEMAEYLKENFNAWKKDGKSVYKGNKSLIKEYSREFQVEQMAKLIHRHL